MFMVFYGQNELVNSVNLLLFNIKSINPIWKFAHIIESNAKFFLIYIFFYDLLKYLNVLIAKTQNIHIITIHLQSYPLCFCWFVLIKIYYICPSFISGKLFIEWIGLHLDSFWYLCVSKLVRRWGGIKSLFQL